MKKIILTGVILTAMSGMMMGCKSSAPVAKPIDVAPQVGEKMIWSSFDQRPGWTVNEPPAKEGIFYFVGLSGKYATEKEGRDDAQRTATNNVVKYIGTFAQDKFQQITTSHGLTSEIVDPTRAVRDFQEQLAQAFTTKIKPKEWYIEKWQDNKTKETYHLVYLLVEVPQASIDKAYEDTLNGNIEDLKKKRDEANDEKAKSQFQNAMNAFEEAKKQGFGFEKK
ncbi:MAG TPA: hypothetical protein VJC37_05765 [Planctomycetota bacterium]|nr:hypothetical protein [Planctomycetota bacterium]